MAACFHLIRYKSTRAVLCVRRKIGVVMNDRVFHTKMDKAENKVRQACLCSNVMAADKSIKAQPVLPDLDDTDARSLNTRPYAPEPITQNTRWTNQRVLNWVSVRNYLADNAVPRMRCRTFDHGRTDHWRSCHLGSIFAIFIKHNIVIF